MPASEMVVAKSWTPDARESLPVRPSPLSESVRSSEKLAGKMSVGMGGQSRVVSRRAVVEVGPGGLRVVPLATPLVPSFFKIKVLRLLTVEFAGELGALREQGPGHLSRIGQRLKLRVQILELEVQNDHTGDDHQPYGNEPWC